ncbi:MAG: hypothetical protein AVDCRST_MAG05-2345, partial [uncultured Rubrobacteraceae bacterium]
GGRRARRRPARRPPRPGGAGPRRRGASGPPSRPWRPASCPSCLPPRRPGRLRTSETRGLCAPASRRVSPFVDARSIHQVGPKGAGGRL